MERETFTVNIEQDDVIRNGVVTTSDPLPPEIIRVSEYP